MNTEQVGMTSGTPCSTHMRPPKETVEIGVICVADCQRSWEGGGSYYYGLRQGR